MLDDKRSTIYHDLHHGQLAQEEIQNRASALKILGILFDYFKPESALDMGCGLGSWLLAAAELGVADVYGVEGSWVDRSQLVVDPQLVTICDLEQEISLERRFDLAICLEVGEHLFEQAAGKLVSSLVRHSDLILFSAAIPHQGGHHHVNERFPDYWAAIFATHKFRPLDFIRPRIWNDTSVLWWLRQNTLIFAHDRLLATNEKLRKEQETARLLSVVHPDIYMSRLQHALNQIGPAQQQQGILAEHQQLIALLSQCGTFNVTRLPDGRINISKAN
jgi:SAM-dependent methyltransferase